MSFAGFINPEDMPPEVRAWFEQLASEAMASFAGAHGRGTPRDGYLVAAVNYALDDDEAELDDEKVQEDHDHVTHLSDYILAKMPNPESWYALSMADKVRAVVTDAYMRMTAEGPGTCVHRDRVQRDLLDIADHIDLTHGFDAPLPDTRVSPAEREIRKWAQEARERALALCMAEWQGRVTDEHLLGQHWCDRKGGHLNRHRCACGVSRVNHG